MPPSMLAGPTQIACGGGVHAPRREGTEIAAEPAAHDALRLQLGADRRRLHADDQDLGVTQVQQVLRGGTGAALVVDLDAGLVRHRAGVHHHERQPGGPDLLHLGVPRGQTDRDHAVHRGAAHRAGQRALQRRDEVERVALLLGRQGDTLREGAEERVREDDRERLGGEHSQRVGGALGEHAGDRVRSIAEGIRDIADTAGRLGRQPIRAVECERHRGLRHARLASDVGDPRPSRVPLLHGLLAAGRLDGRWVAQRAPDLGPAAPARPAQVPS